MNRRNDVEQAIRNLRVTTDRATDERIVADASVALARAAAPDALAGGIKPKPKRTSIQRIFTMTMGKPSRMAAGVVFLAGIVGVLIWLAVGGGMASVALADVRAGVDRARTVCFRSTFRQGDEPEMTAKVMFLRPGLMRQETPKAAFVIDWNTGEMISLFPEAKMAHAGTVTGMKNPFCRNWLADLKKIVGSDRAEDVGEKETDGRKLRGWRVRNADGTVTVWADAKTAELVQIEFLDIAGADRMVWSDFEYDRQLDESLFSLEAPDGYGSTPRLTAKYSDLALKDVAGLLHIWALGNGGVFPDNLNPWEFHATAGKVTQAQWKEAGKTYEALSYKAVSDMIGRGFLFLNSKPGCKYVGKGVRLGDAKTPVFRYAPNGAKKAQVIYGDLHVGSDPDS